MQKVIDVKEIETTLNENEEIIEPIIVKRKNKSDVVILSIDEYKEKFLEEEIIKHLKKSEEDIKNKRTIPADKVFEELRNDYDY